MSAPAGTFSVCILDGNPKRWLGGTLTPEEVERSALLLLHKSAEVGDAFTSGVLAVSTISTSTLTTQ